MGPGNDPPLTAVISTDPAPTSFRLLLWLIGLFALTCVIVYTAPPNFTQHNEDRMALYVYDIIQNGQWLCPSLAGAGLMTKPPLYAWLAALASLAAGRVTPWALYLPSTLSMLGLVIGTYLIGRRYFGWAAGFVGALTLLASPVASEEIAGCRYDTLFALTVLLAGAAAFRAWMTGRGWTWFWLACAVGTLTKGPLAVVLSGIGLIAAWWERREAPAPVRGSHWWGVSLFFLITGGWFVLAYLSRGRALIDTLLLRELVQQNVVNDRGHLPLTRAYETPLYFLTNYLPWSPFAFLALWRIWRKPSPEPVTRRFERFLACWLVIGLLLFALAAHQRSRLVLPLIPVAALLTGRYLTALRPLPRQRLLWRVALPVSLVTLLILGVVRYRIEPTTRHVRRTAALHEMARHVQATVGPYFPLTYADDTFAFSFFLGRLQPFISPQEAAHLLAGPDPVFITMRDTSQLPGSNAPPVHVLQQWPTNREPVLSIVSNHDRLEWTPSVVMVAGPWQLHLTNAAVVRVESKRIVLHSRTGPGGVAIKNRASHPIALRVFVEPSGTQSTPPLTRRVEPGATWTISLSPRLL